MSLITAAGYMRVVRGLEYFKEGKVVECNKIGEDLYSGKVAGSLSEPYEVTIDLKHVTKSVCNCAFAKDNRKICKHKVALYLTVHPEEYDKLSREYYRDPNYWENKLSGYDDYDDDEWSYDELEDLWAEICEHSVDELRKRLYYEISGYERE